MEMEGLFGSHLGVNDVKRIVYHALKHPQGAAWFTSEWTLFNEQAIIYRDKEETHLRRPDRVMLSPDHQHVVVVDFKFGKPRPEYTAQVSEYMHLLRQMGYPQVDGYLWYVYKGNIEKVEISEE